MTPPTNAKGRPFSWSYSALNKFENCPKNYAAEKFYCTVPFIETEALKWGSRVHKAAELFLQGINPMDDEALEPVEGYTTAMMRSGWKIEAELEVALTRKLTSINWFSKAAWFRAKIDVILSDYEKTTAKQVDWKTGKVKDDPDQLRICSAALSTIRPHIKYFEGRFIFTAHKVISKPIILTKDDIPGVWQEVLPRVHRMEEAWATENFPAKPSGLCPWCAVDNCNQRRGARRV